MIKKARDIQLGDRIGGRLIAFKDTDFNLTILRFADRLDYAGVEFASEDDVWVDDPAPCCKPATKSATVHLAREIRVGDIVHLRVTGCEPWHDGANVALHFGEFGELDFYADDMIVAARGGDNDPDLAKLSTVLA